MKFEKTPLAGSYIIRPDRREDKRGMFARIFCAEKFLENGLENLFVQGNLTRNHLAGTVRGMHYQVAPHEEAKLVSCVWGAVFDVIVDLRESSPTFLKWFGAELSEENGLMMYVPKGFAHGYQTLRTKTAVHYLVSTPYRPEAEKGLFFDDPILGIRWPLQVREISSKDLAWPPLPRRY